MLASLTSVVRPLSPYALEHFFPKEVRAQYEENPLLFSLIDGAKMRGYNRHEAGAEVYHAYYLSLFNGRAEKPYDVSYVEKRWADPVVWCVPNAEDSSFLNSDIPFFTPSRIEFKMGFESQERSLVHLEKYSGSGDYASFVVVHNVPDTLYACIDKDKCVGVLMNGTTLPIVMSDRQTANSMLGSNQVLMSVLTTYLDVGKMYPEVPTGPNIGLRFVYVHYDERLPKEAFDVVRG